MIARTRVAIALFLPILILMPLASTAAESPNTLFSIKPKAPPQITSVTQDVSFPITITDLKSSHRTVTYQLNLVNDQGVIVWKNEERLEFAKEKSVTFSVYMKLPALPPGPYELVCRIPDVTFPKGPESLGAALTFADDTEPLPAIKDEAPAADVHALVVRTPITVVPYVAPDKSPKEPFVLRVTVPDSLPAGPSLLQATVTVSQVQEAQTGLTLNVAFVDDLGRAFWQTRQPLPPALEQPATFPFSAPLPPLPAGQYFLDAVVCNEAGQAVGPALPSVTDALTAWFNPKDAPALPTGAVRRPIARLERFDFDRDLLWGTWDRGNLGPVESEGVKAAGINVGRRANYHFRYRWFVDHDLFRSTGLWPEQAAKNPEAADLTHYQKWMSWIKNDPGFVVMDMYDELGWRKEDDPVKNRLNKLMYYRNRENNPGIPTITKWNAMMMTDALGWDEILRDDFPAATGPNAIKLKWAFQACVNDLIRLRMDRVRELNPGAQLTPGMGAGLLDNFYDSMHNRAYNKYTTLQFYGLFTAGIPQYGNMPWSWLINLKSPFEQCSRIVWASLANAGRFFPIYSPGDGYGDRIADSSGKLTASGEMLKRVHDRIQPLAPVLLGVRNRIDTDVLYYHPGWASLENGLFEGLLACGVQPDCGTNLTGRKLLVFQDSKGTTDSNALIHAAREGAGLIFSPIAYSNVAAAFNLPLSPVLIGARTNGWTGRVGQGWILGLTTPLPTNRPANAAFMRALLDQAGIKETFRFTDEAGAFHPGILGSLVETADRSQSYVIVVAESAADIQSRFRPMDPAILAVRDLCAENTLEWKQDAAGRYVEVNLPKGVGTMLALIKESSGDRLQVSAPASISGGQTLSLALAKLDAKGVPLKTSHTFRIRILGPDGRELPGLANFGTGPGPVTLSQPVALSDPPGEWTIQAEDLTDGSTATAKLIKNDSATAPTAPAIAPQPQPPYSLVVEETPAMEGDVILVTLKGHVFTSLPGTHEVSVEPAIPAAFLLECPARLSVTPAPDKPAPFAFTYRLSREEAQALRGGRNQGVAVRLTVPGREDITASWKVPVSPYLRAPHHNATVSGGAVSLRVDNFTGKNREVTLAFDPYPGWADGTRATLKRITAGTSARFDWPVTWNDPVKLDPGFAWLPLRATVDGAAFAAGKVFLDQDLEQEWWIGLLVMKPGEETDWNPCAMLALDPAAANKKGWTRVTTETVLWWPALAARLVKDSVMPACQMAAVTQVRAPEAKKVRVGFTGPTAPARIFVNGVPVEADWAALRKTGGVRSEPVLLNKGLNTVAVEVLLPVPDTAATSLVIQDAATGKRDRTLNISLVP
jgi:hypothetical protein